MWVFWLQGMWVLSSPTRSQTHIPHIGRRSLTHWTTREVPCLIVHPCLKAWRTFLSAQLVCPSPRPHTHFWIPGRSFTLGDGPRPVLWWPEPPQVPGRIGRKSVDFTATKNSLYDSGICGQLKNVLPKEILCLLDPYSINVETHLHWVLSRIRFLPIMNGRWEINPCYQNVYCYFSYSKNFFKINKHISPTQRATFFATIL